ncbi:interferon regulatory factor 9 isoform X6 [Ovis canadensis]|uniref:interferon regulatory factor 9 isoform X6 n=1 Tax=Ovis canadensis TaxID=37174 RepID=UPI00375273CF
MRPRPCSGSPGSTQAWAVFKGKYKEGNSEGPAIWKTRLRCALNKSCEFEEVPEIGHRDGAEPYKVYRLLPSGTVPAQSGTQKLPSKRPHSSAFPEKKEEEVTTKNCILSPSLLQEPPQNETVETNGGAGRLDFGSSGSSSSSSNSPEPQEGGDTAEALFQGELLSLELLPPPDSDYSLLLTFIYNGRVVGEAQVQSLDCRLVAEPSSSQCSMEQRLCPIPISWNAPQMPSGPGPHLLPINECVELFRTNYFCRDLARYFQGLGPPPKFQVTLNFWEENPDPSHTSQSLIAVQMEQAFARRMLKETPEEQAAALSLLQSLQDPLPSLSIPPVFFEAASASLRSTCLP